MQADGTAYAERTTAGAIAEANNARAASLKNGNQEVIAANRLIEVLPSIVEAAARGIANSSLTILNGTEGVSEVLAGIVGQGLSVLEVLKRYTATASPAAATSPAAVNGSRPATPASS